MLVRLRLIPFGGGLSSRKYLRLASTQKVEIGAVDQEDVVGRHGLHLAIASGKVYPKKRFREHDGVFPSI